MVDQSPLLTNLPTHLAFIMDGNGRWAKKRGLPRTFGHQRGVRAAKIVLQSALKYRIKYITLYAFSTENFKRPENEVTFLMNLFLKSIKKYSKFFLKNDIKFRVIGEPSRLPSELREEILSLQKSTKEASSLVVNIAINYGARNEIVRAVQHIIDSKRSDISWKDIRENLYTADIPDPDMIVRTSGEYRLSNFLLLQAAYSELYFPEIYWPDVSEQTFADILREFQRRDRRMGGI